MTMLKEINLPALFANHQPDVFVETGTGRGCGLQEALLCDFNEWWSVDIMEESQRDVRARLGCENVNVICQESVPFVVDRCLGRDGRRILWWLDAHFPGVDTNLQPQEATLGLPFNTRMPGRIELQIIHAFGNYEKDVILVDDAFFYRAGVGRAVRGIDIPNWCEQALGTLEPVLAKFEPTHDIRTMDVGTGVIALTPKG